MRGAGAQSLGGGEAARRNPVRRLRAEIAWVSWPPWGDRQSELFYDIYSTHADVMRRAYRATHSYVYMVWDGRRWLQQVDGLWVGI